MLIYEWLSIKDSDMTGIITIVKFENIVTINSIIIHTEKYFN